MKIISKKEHFEARIAMARIRNTILIIKLRFNYLNT
jgi:hypothetical protein